MLQELLATLVTSEELVRGSLLLARLFHFSFLGSELETVSESQ